MGHVVESAETAQHIHVPQEVPAVLVQEAVAEILVSNPFRASKQSQELLRFIVDNTLSGHTELLKERVIGIEVFGRRPDYDTSSDPIVRSRVSEVRKRLALYYQTEHEKSVRITVPLGSFKAIFEWTDGNRYQPASVHAHEPEVSKTPVQSVTSPIAQEQIQPETKTRLRGLLTSRWLLAALVLLAVLVAAAKYYLPTSEARAFDQFWSPILADTHTTLIYVGGNAVYQLTPSFLATYYRDHPRSHSEEMGYESYIPLPAGTKIDAQDLYPAKDTFVTIGDVAAITRLEALLVHRNRQFNVRYGGDLAYSDLRENPAILVGAHNNFWTLATTENLRYTFAGPSAIVDRSNPGKQWSTNPNFTEDYAIVSRVSNAKTGTKMIATAGVGYAGTQAAAEFVTNPQAIAALVKSLPRGWEKKNLQIVLHTSVTNRLPGSPDVIAVYCW